MESEAEEVLVTCPRPQIVMANPELAWLAGNALSPLDFFQVASTRHKHNVRPPSQSLICSSHNYLYVPDTLLSS